MSERILKALMQLFAIVAKINVIEESDEIVAADSSKNIVEILLKQDLNSLNLHRRQLTLLYSLNGQVTCLNLKLQSFYQHHPYQKLQL